MTLKPGLHAPTDDNNSAKSTPSPRLSPQAQQAARTAALIAADGRIIPLHRVLSAKRESWDKVDLEDLR